MTIVAGMESAKDDEHVAWSLDQRRIAYLEGELRRIAHGNSAPAIDSASANTYAHIVNEMQNIASLALTAIVAE